MNSVLEGFILSLVSSIHFLMLSRHSSSFLMVSHFSLLHSALKFFLMLWSLANPLSCKSSGNTSWNSQQYKLKMLAPAQLPCGTLTSESLFAASTFDCNFQRSWSYILIEPFKNLTINSILIAKYRQ